ncbi:hypothetical protein [Nostoc spongiaeforme]|nr:hypothetical protein [Nostoc spongiaeforme]
MIQALSLLIFTLPDLPMRVLSLIFGSSISPRLATSSPEFLTYG